MGYHFHADAENSFIGWGINDEVSENQTSLL